MGIRPWGKLNEYDPAPAMVDGPDILIADDGRVFVGDLADLQLACRGFMYTESSTTLYLPPSWPLVIDQGLSLIAGIRMPLSMGGLSYGTHKLAAKEHFAQVKILLPNDRMVTKEGVAYRERVSTVGMWSFSLDVIETGAIKTLWLHHIEHPKAPIGKALDWLRRPLEIRSSQLTTIQEKMQRLCRRFDLYLISRITKIAKRNGHVFFEGYEHDLA